MLLEFSVQNLLSLKDKQVISLLPVGRNANQVETGTTYEPHALPVIGLFGPNGAGKSNLVYAIRYLIDSLKFSGRLSDGDPLPVPTFGFVKESVDSVAELEITVVVESTIWRYGFALSREKIHREWLYARRKGSPERPAFVRDMQSIVTSNWVKGDKHTWIKNTLKNQLHLSKISENDSGEISRLYQYITRSIFVVESSRNRRLGFFTALRCTNGDNLHIVEDFLQSLGVDIDRLKVEVIESDGGVLQLERGEGAYFSGKIGGKDTAYEVNFLRDIDDDTTISLGIDQESSGNQSLFHMAAPILDAINDGSVIVIDEIDNSLHTTVLKRIIDMWIDSELNENKSQLIFTAHDTSVMNDGRLEKDQVYLLHKNEDHATEIFSLADVEFEDGEKLRRTAAFGRQYLSGRFGALPEFDPHKLLRTMRGGD